MHLFAPCIITKPLSKGEHLGKLTHTLIKWATNTVLYTGVMIQWSGTVEWNDGMERWNGMMEWNGGMEWNDHAQRATAISSTRIGYYARAMQNLRRGACTGLWIGIPYQM